MKGCDYFSEIEDQKFSNDVIRFNHLDDGDSVKESMRARLKDRTQILLYQIPIRNLFLTEDEASEIYLSARDDIDRIISSYTINRATYNSYIAKICKYKALSNAKLHYTNSRLEEGFCYTLKLDYENTELEFFQEEPFYGETRPEIFEMDIKALIDYIANTRDTTEYSHSFTPDEAELHIQMQDESNRRRMMIFLLSLPQIETPRFIDSIARIMQLDSMVFSYFYTLRFNLLGKANKRWEECQNTAHRHYKALLNMQPKLSRETDSKKLSELESAYSRIYQNYIKNIDEAKRRKRGLTQMEIAAALGIKRSTVCYAIAQIKCLMIDIVGEI